MCSQCLEGRLRIYLTKANNCREENGEESFLAFLLFCSQKEGRKRKGEGAKRRRSDVPQLHHFGVTVDPCHRVVAGSCYILDESEKRRLE